MPKKFDKMNPEETLLNQTELETIILTSEMEKNVIILGVIHNNEKEYNCYKRLIERFKPSCILYEASQESGNEPIFNDWIDNDWLENHNVKSISCDLTDKEKKTIQNEISCNYRITRDGSEISDRLYYNEIEKRMGGSLTFVLVYKNKLPFKAHIRQNRTYQEFRYILPDELVLDRQT